MIVRRDFRERGRSGEVVIKMSLVEFREHVEWLELVDGNDQATHDWRATLDEVDPRAPECTGDPITCPACEHGVGCMAVDRG